MDVKKVTLASGFLFWAKPETTQAAGKGATILQEYAYQGGSTHGQSTDLMKQDEFIRTAQNDNKPSLVITTGHGVGLYSGGDLYGGSGYAGRSPWEAQSTILVEADEIDLSKLHAGDAVQLDDENGNHIRGFVAYLDNQQPTTASAQKKP